jgi:hypothetical protein
MLSIKLFDVNKLTINLAKTSYITFGKHILNDFNLVMQDKPLVRIESTKFLGVKIDAQLTWKDHIKHVENKIIKIRTLNMIKYKLDQISLIKIYNT